MVFELLAVLVWLVNPYASLLVLPALHLWLGALLLRRPLFCRVAPGRSSASLLTLAGLVPLGLVLAYYASAFGMGPVGAAPRGRDVRRRPADSASGGCSRGASALGCFAAILLAVLLRVAEPDGR